MQTGAAREWTPKRKSHVSVLAALVVFVVVASALATTEVPSASGAASQRPNVVLIMTDDMRKDALARMQVTKRRLAHRGVRFAHAVNSNPLCCPARAGLLTGQYSHNNGIWSNKSDSMGGGFEDFRASGANRRTLPKWLWKSGYHTAFVGKYLNGYSVHGDGVPEPGWSEWRAISGRVGNYLDTIISHNGTKRRTQKYITAKLNDIAVNVIGRRAPKPKPFFLWLAHIAPHGGVPHEADDPADIPTPHVAPRDRNTSSIDVPNHPGFNEADVSDKPEHIRVLEPIDDDRRAQIRENRQQHIESLQAVDRGVRRIIEALRRAGELRNTIIVFASDNGYSMGEHRRKQGKTLPYDEIIAAPLLMRGPGLPAGHVVTQPVAAMQDVMATVLHWANIWGRYCCQDSPVAIDGRTLVPLIADPDKAQDRAVLLEGVGGGVGTSPDGIRHHYQGVRTNWGTYVEYTTGERELYSSSDRWQLDSLHDTPANASDRQSMSADLDRLRDCSRRSCRR